MSHFGSKTEHGLHCLVTLCASDGARPMSAKLLAEYQGLSVSYVRKLLTSLERAGLIVSQEGRAGGFLPARPAHEITVLEVVDALEGRKRLFDCKEIRQRCALFDDDLPKWATRGPCEINAVMLRAEEAMRAVLGDETIADINESFGRKAPATFRDQAIQWFEKKR